MDKQAGAGHGRLALARRVAALVAALAAAALLAAACRGSHLASSAQGVAQEMGAFARCMRGNGEPNFYYASPQSAQGSSTPALGVGTGYVVIGVDPQTAQFASAMKTCKHLMPGGGGGPRVTQQQIARWLKFAACMRAHGFPSYPDPEVNNGVRINVPMPASIDTSSPQFLAAEKACGA